MADTRKLADFSMEELRQALVDAEERVDLSKYTKSEASKRRAVDELDAIKAEIALRNRRQAT
jgi:hypothetical protein